MPTAGVTDLVLAMQRTAGNRATTIAVQRQLTRSANSVTTPFNLATQILTGRELGITPPVVNGAELPVDAGTAAAASAALQPPAVTTAPAGGHYEAKVTGQPVNQVGAHVKLPAPPPASRVVDATAATMMLGVADTTPVRHGWIYASAKPAAVIDRQGNTTVIIEGVPSNAGFHAAIQSHEEHHADDHWAVAQHIIGSWDQQLRRPDLVGTGDTPATATADLYRQAGGTPDQLGARLDHDWAARSDAFHRTDEGDQSDLHSIWVAKDGSKVHAYWGYNPPGRRRR